MKNKIILNLPINKSLTFLSTKLRQWFYKSNTCSVQQPSLHSMALSITLFSFTLLFLTHHQLVHAESTHPPYSCGTSNSPKTSSYPFCNPKHPIRDRARDLVSRLTLDEKLSQLVNSAPSIPRLGIPSYQWWNEALHGVADAGKGLKFNGTIKGATSFPQVILTASSFDPNLWYQISKVS